MFRPAYDCEDWLGVAGDEDHMVFRWSEARVFFSCCLKGDALSAHFSAEKRAVRLLKQAIEEFCLWVFGTLQQCKMILACIVRPSVERLVLKCGFSHLKAHDDLQIYMRAR